MGIAPHFQTSAAVVASGRGDPPRAEVTIVRSLRDLFRRQQPQETPCPRCGVPAPQGDVECTACGWDLRDAYRDPVAEAAKGPLTG